MGVTGEKFRYYYIAAFIFVGSSLLSFFTFRHSQLSVSARLAKIEFRPEFSRTLEATGQLKPADEWVFTATTGGKIDSISVKSGDQVTKDQTIALIDDASGRENLKAAIVAFKAESQKFESTKEKFERGAVPQTEFETDQASYLARRQALESAKRAIENNLIRAPMAGLVTLEPLKVGDLVAAGSKLGAIQDFSKFTILSKLALQKQSDLPTHGKIQVILPPPAAPLEVLANLRVSAPRPDVLASETPIEIALATNEALIPFTNKSVKVLISLPALKNVALIDKKAVVTTSSDSKILVLNTFGFLHWQSVAGAPTQEDKIIVSGVDPKTFKVVLPEDPERLNQAITLNVKPKITGGS